MYTQEELLKAIELYIKTNRSIKAVISTLGYPSPNMLRNWYRSHLRGEESQQKRTSKYSEEYKQSVIDSYYENGEDISLTAKQNGVPRSTLADWLQERHISHRPACISGTDVVKYGDEHKLMAVTEAACGTDLVFRMSSVYLSTSTFL
jgi:transposase-like protein